MKQKVILIGGFHKAKVLAVSLVKKGYAITVINDSYKDCLALAENSDLNVIEGDGSKPYVLEDACVQEADIAIALTQNDDDNLVICELCKKNLTLKKRYLLSMILKRQNFFTKWELIQSFAQLMQ